MILPLSMFWYLVKKKREIIQKHGGKMLQSLESLRWVFRILMVLLFLVWLGGLWFDLNPWREYALRSIGIFYVVFLLAMQPLPHLVYEMDAAVRELRHGLAKEVPLLGWCFCLVLFLTWKWGPNQIEFWMIFVILSVFAFGYYLFFRIGPHFSTLMIHVVVIGGIVTARWIFPPALEKLPDPNRPPEEFENPIIITDPPGARIYLDWEFLGSTPLKVGRLDKDQLMVVVKDGHEAVYRTIHKSRPFFLQPRNARLRDHDGFLLHVTGPPEWVSLSDVVRTELMALGWFPSSYESSTLFNRELAKADRSIREDFLSWARARFRTSLLVVLRLHGASMTFSPIWELTGTEVSPPEHRQSVGVTFYDLQTETILHEFTITNISWSSLNAAASMIAGELEKKLKTKNNSRE